MLAPRHFRNVNQAFHTRSYFDERTVICHHNHFAFHLVAYFQLSIQSVPRMRSKLFQTQSDTLLLVIEVEDNDVELLIQFDYFLRIAYTAPRKVCNVNQAVYAAQVDEYSVRGDKIGRASCRERV